MIRVDISPIALEKVNEENKRIGVLRKSFTNGESQIYGLLGELMFKTVFPEAEKEIRVPQKYEYDFLFHGQAIEVKSRMFYAECRRSWSQIVAGVTKKQICDCYVFASIHQSLSYGYLVGWCPSDYFNKKSKLLNEGDIDENTKARIRARGYYIDQSEMRNIAMLSSGAL